MERGPVSDKRESGRGETDMKAAFINPKGTIFSRDQRLAAFLAESVTMGSFRHFWSAPCLGLLAMAAYCPPEWETAYIDENQRPLDPEEDYELVCISAMTVQAVRAYEIADSYRRKGAMVVMGGIHATVLPEEALKHVDVVIAGEGEALFPLFLQDFAAKKTRRLYREEKPGHFSMKECITPRYELLRDYDYPVINLYTTRGCPRQCRFCCASNVYGLRYRRKDNGQIIREIEHIVQLYPDRLLLFADDNLFVRRRESKELLRLLEPMKIRWIAQTDISIAEDEELLKLMADSGCQWIVIGFESVSENSLEELERGRFKQRYLPEYADCIRRIQAWGIGIYGTFIVGLDGDGPEIFDETAAFIQDNHLYGANITVPTPLPGTKMREDMCAQGRVMDKGWESYTLWDVVASPRSMSTEELEDGLLKLYQKTASPRRAAERLQSILRQRRARRHRRCEE